MSGGGDAMSTSTSYPFYITLDSTEGLLLGQHVYIQISAAAVGGDGIEVCLKLILLGGELEESALLHCILSPLIVAEYDGPYSEHSDITAEVGHSADEVGVKPFGIILYALDAWKHAARAVHTQNDVDGTAFSDLIAH